MDNNDHNPLQKHYTLEQAANYLREKRETIKEDIKKEASHQDITVAPAEDRHRYLQYCISLLEEVDNDIMGMLPDNIRNSYSRRDMAQFFRAFLGMKICHYSDERIASEFGVPVKLVKTLDVLAQEAVFRAVKEKREKGIPILGGR